MKWYVKVLIGLGVVVVPSLLILRLFFFEFYSIPTGSMSPGVEMGSYVLVKKTVELERNAVLAFHFPEGDTVVSTNPHVSYYEIKLEAEVPIDRLEVMSLPNAKERLARLIGIPGDLFEIATGSVVINGKAKNDLELKHSYWVRTDNPSGPRSHMETLKAALEDASSYTVGNMRMLSLTEKQLFSIRMLEGVEIKSMYEIDQKIPKGRSPVFPRRNFEDSWTVDNFGPLRIPAKGKSIQLSMENIDLYERVIRVYEGHELNVAGGNIQIDGVKVDQFVPRQNYYFVMGDNRHNSHDSRFFGFVPEELIIGKVVKVF